MNIMEELQKRWDYLHKLPQLSHNKILGIFVFGSQNYGLDTPESDIDVKVVVLPSFNDISCGRVPYNETVLYIDGSHLDVIDVRAWFKSFKKTDMMALESLYTDYYLVDDYFLPIYRMLRQNRDAIAFNDPHRLQMSVKGWAHSFYQKIKSDECGYVTGKSVTHIIRLYNFLYDYVEHLKVEFHPYSANDQYYYSNLKNIKSGKDSITLLTLTHFYNNIEKLAEKTVPISQTHSISNIEIDEYCDMTLKKFWNDILKSAVPPIFEYQNS